MKQFALVGIILALGLYFSPALFKNPPNQQEQDPLELVLPLTDLSTEQTQSSVAMPVASRQASSTARTTPSAPTDSDVYNVSSQHLVARRQGDVWVTMGDILVDEDQLLAGVGDETVRIAEIQGIQYWPSRQIPYEIDPALDADLLFEAMAEINQATLIQFVERYGESDYVYFRSSPAEICQSYLGKKGGEQEVLLHASCSKGQILHELLHVLGFVHEHSRADRDHYLAVLWENIDKPYLNQFQKLPPELSQPVELDFDFESILLYPINAFSGNGQYTLTKLNGDLFFANRQQLSAFDVARVNRLYERF